MSDINNKIDEFVRDVTKVHPLPKSEVRRRLTALIQSEVREGRIDELKSTQTRLMSVGIGENKLSALIEERIKSLKKGI